MTEQYGPPIPVNGARPDWLRDGEMCKVDLPTHSGWSVEKDAEVWEWELVNAILLQIDNPYYASTGTLASEPEPEIAATQIEMGHGKVDVGIIHWQGRSGLLLAPRDEVIPVGQDGKIVGDYWSKSGDVIIWIDRSEGADVIAKELAPLCSPPASGASVPTGNVMATYNSRTHVAVLKMTEAAIRRDMRFDEQSHTANCLVDTFRALGIIPDPIEVFAAKHGLSEPATAELRDMLGDAK